MSVDAATVKKVARLARIAVTDAEAQALEGDLNGILDWVDQLSEVDVSGVEPMTSVTPMALKMRDDAVSAGAAPETALANAPEQAEGFFVVPKVVE